MTSIDEQATKRLYRTLWDFMKAADEGEHHRMLSAHPDLLSTEAEALLDFLLEHARSNRDTEGEKLFLNTKNQLAAYRERGIPPNPGLTLLLKELDSHMSTGNKQATISLLRRGLTIVVAQDPYWVRPSLHWTLGHILAGNTPRAQPAEDVEEAITHYQRALDALDENRMRTEWAMIHNWLGIAYRGRKFGNEADNIELAISHYEKSLQVFTLDAFPEDWAMAQNNLAAAFKERQRGNRADNLEYVISHAEQAAQFFTRATHIMQWTEIQLKLATAYRERLRGDRAQNVEFAIQFYQNVIESSLFSGQDTDWGAEHWANAHLGLAQCYAKRAIGTPSETLQLASSHVESAQNVYTREANPEGWAHCENWLGIFYKNFAAGTADQRRARTHFQHALQVFTRSESPREWAMAHSNIANFYSVQVSDRAQNLERAIDHTKLSLSVDDRAAHPRDWATSHYNLGRDYHQRILGDHHENLRQAVQHYQLALEVLTVESDPVGHLRAQRNLADAYMDLGDWAHAHDTYTAAIGSGDILLASSLSEASQRAELEETGLLHGKDAFCMLQMGRVNDAFLQLERGKARALANEIALADIWPTETPTPAHVNIAELRKLIAHLEAEESADSDVEKVGIPSKALSAQRDKLRALVASLHPEEMRGETGESEINTWLDAIPAGGALVAPIVTGWGTSVFILPDGTRTISNAEVLHLSDVRVTPGFFYSGSATDTGLQASLSNYLDRIRDEEQRLLAVDSLAPELWDALLGPIHERLIEMGMTEGAPLVFLTQGGLGLFPLHAACRDIAGRPRPFLADYTVQYAPSLRAFYASVHRANRSEPFKRALLLVADPTKNLAYAEIEGRAITKLFTGSISTVLTHEEATLDSVIRASNALGYGYLHFACHGKFDRDSPIRSGLILGNGTSLSLSTIMNELQLQDARLVTLSACDTGLVQSQRAADEQVGLSTAFMAAGSAAVISALWPVDDFSTMLLMERFYASHLGGASISSALREAQLWLRDLQVQELKALLDSDHQSGRGSEGAAPGDMRWPVMQSFELADPTLRPFENPHYWAAFILNGA